MTAPVLLPLVKIGYRRREAAEFVGVSPSKFDAMIKDGRMPRGHKVDSMTIWRGDELLDAFNALTGAAVKGARASGDDWGDY